MSLLIDFHTVQKGMINNDSWEEKKRKTEKMASIWKRSAKMFNVEFAVKELQHTDKLL